MPKSNLIEISSEILTLPIPDGNSCGVRHAYFLFLTLRQCVCSVPFPSQSIPQGQGGDLTMSPVSFPDEKGEEGADSLRAEISPSQCLLSPCCIPTTFARPRLEGFPHDFTQSLLDPCQGTSILRQHARRYFHFEAQHLSTASTLVWGSHTARSNVNA